MKKWLSLLGAVMVLAPLVQTAADAQTANEEQRFIAVLQSGASLAEKDAACSRLKLIGTARCVPALSALLTDEQLSHSARYALEPMQAPEASQALLDALSKTKGLIKVGLINSLAARRETRAVAELAKLLQDPDTLVVSASARALGQIANPAAVKALQTASKNTSDPLHAAAVDGLLRSGTRLLEAKEQSKALALFEHLYNTEQKDSVRLAAFEGMIRASGKSGLTLMVNGIQSEPGPSQTAALQLVGEIEAPHATETLAGLLSKLPPNTQVALIDGLGQRGDPAATPALVALASTGGIEVRIPIINALATIGDASVVGLLAQLAAAGSSDQQRAARQALVDLRRGAVTETLVAQLGSSNPAVQSELARALGSRGDRAAIPKLLQLAANSSDSTRNASLQALAMLVDEPQLGSLVQLVTQAKDPAQRAQAAEAVSSASLRLQSRQGGAKLQALADGLNHGSNEARIALLPICSGLANSVIRGALRSALKDADPQVRAAATRALCESVDPELLDDVVRVAGATQDNKMRTLAITGGVRLASQEEGAKLPIPQRVAALKSLLGVADQPEQKRLVLAGLAETPDLESLKLVEPLLDDPSVQSEAARAVVKLAATLPARNAPNSLAVLKKALGATSDEATRKAVEAALQHVQVATDYLTDWQIAGPYRQAGKDYAALFDVAFAPETQAAEGVRWQELPSGGDPKLPCLVDLLKALGGEQCVAYARTSIHSDQDQQAVLELGSDDGVKVWLNDKQVYALNTARAVQPGSDKVNVTLHSGWNSLMLKITQNNQGWGFCARLLKPDGSHLDGVRCDAVAKAANN
jgi:HEAT repeat protein